MPGRATFDYSVKPGHSVYPIEAGVVIKLTEPKHKLNRSAKVHLSHDIYLWICRLGNQPSRLSPKYRKVHILIAEVPTLRAFREHLRVVRKTVQFRYLTTLMKGHKYEIVSRKCRQNYTDWSLRNFYKIIGELI